MRNLALLLLCASAVLLDADPSAARCLAYEPARVTLEGQVSARRLPGPPYYRSIARGDYPETVHFVVLKEPICVSADPSSRINPKSHAGITEVQLVISADQARKAAGRRVRLTGTLSGARTAEHRTPVVLTVVALKSR